jgi:predicted nucleic-acid-binding Zn-ribbon protein
MRIIAELPHPECKISLFNMNQKYIVKFEQGTLEQSYKLSELDLTGGGANEIFQILDEEFIATVIERFKSMRTDFSQAYKRQQY